MVVFWTGRRTHTMEQPIVSQSSPAACGGKSKPKTQYIDLLEERRASSDLRWAAREWSSRGDYRYRLHLSRNDIFNRVMGSERVKHTISQLAKNEQDQEALEEEVKGILEQMGHTQDIGTIRQFAFILPKIMKRIYGKVLINEEGIEKLRRKLVETPVILLPTHRSYADFLLVSYIAYHFNLPLPVIAAGMDFMSMAVIGEMLRRSGAFYIRRTFMDNALYWAVFQEYVQTIVECTGSPLEFFLEGTRSRSGKSLPPKIGLLGCVSECWLRGRLPDLAVVPISISYDRTLEEKLYAYELLGVPKPKESTSGLLKATSILKENFGDIRIHVGDPISARSFLLPRVERHLTAAVPSHLAPLLKNELSACEALGLHVLHKIQMGSLTSVWSIVCVQLMQALWRGQWMVPLKGLVEDVSWLVGIFQKVGGEVAVEGSVEDTVRHSLAIHQQVATLGANDVVHIQQIHQPNQQSLHLPQKVATLSSGTIENAVTHLMLQHYINQSLHLLIRPALVAQALVSRVSSNAVCPIEELQSRFFFLRSLMSNDFIFEKDTGGKDFMEGLSLLTWSGEVSFIQGSVHHTGRGNKLMSLLLGLLKPFVITYSCAAETLASQDWLDNGEVVLAIQRHVERIVASSGVYSALSLDPTRHALRSLIKLGMVEKRKGMGDQTTLSPNQEKLQTVLQELGRSSEGALRPKL
ncbi:dihydroxyacetone phosphate acyltransferase isoform X1 [Penaeus vannamei]